MFSTIRPSERMLQAVTQNDTAELIAALDDGADVNFRRTKNTPILLALSNGHKECAQILLDRGADVNIDNGHGWLPIHEVCRIGWEDWAEKIISNPMNMTDRRDRGDSTPLLVAVENGHERIAMMLIEQDCNVNAQNAQGVSPLMLAIERQSRDLVREMMARRGDPSLKDGSDRSGLDRAENWSDGKALLGAAVSAAETRVEQVEPEAAVQQEAGVSGIQKRRRPV